MIGGALSRFVGRTRRTGDRLSGCILLRTPYIRFNIAIQGIACHPWTTFGVPGDERLGGVQAIIGPRSTSECGDGVSGLIAGNAALEQIGSDDERCYC